MQAMMLERTSITLLFNTRVNKNNSGVRQESLVISYSVEEKQHHIHDTEKNDQSFYQYRKQRCRLYPLNFMLAS